MRNYILLFMLVITCPVIAQESIQTKTKRRGAELYYGVGLDNNKYKDVNRFLRDYNFQGNFKTYALSFAVGFVFTREKTKFELFASASDQNFTSGSKKLKTQNQSIQLLYYYHLIKKGWLHTSVYSGLSMLINNLQIDSIYKPSGFGAFNSINADKVFIDIPVGLQLTHYFPGKNTSKPYASKYLIGLKAAYHITISQSDWSIGQNTKNSLKYKFNQPNYFEVNLIFGFYH